MKEIGKHIEDLLTDRNFVRWVRESDQSLDIYWEKWLNANYQRKDDLQLAREILLRAEFSPVEAPADLPGEVLERILGTTVSQNVPDKRKFSGTIQVWYPIRVAAVLAIVAVFTGLLVWLRYMQDDTNEVQHSDEVLVKQNIRGVRSMIQLPDGSFVWLNAESTIEYPAHFDSVSRRVVLTGEAFFEVMEDEDRPFTVHAGNLSTTALGTSFNVSAYPDEGETSVSLLTGRVMIKGRGQDTNDIVVLNPGEQARVVHNTNQLRLMSFDYETTFGWKHGMLVFKEANLEQIVSRLERWYGVDITIVGVPREPWRISGVFDRQSLERVLQRLSFTKDFGFSIQDKYVHIIFNPKTKS